MTFGVQYETLSAGIAEGSMKGGEDSATTASS